MTFTATVVRVLIASPSDLRDERDVVERVIHAWNANHAEHHQVVLLPVRWETNASAESGARPQDVINRQIVDDCDVLLGMFWTRIGTPTGAAESGTAEELQRFLDTDRPASLFHSRKPVELSTVDPQQYEALKAFLDRQRENGLINEFQTPEELAVAVERALTRIVRERYLQGGSAGPPVPAGRALVSEPPADLRAQHVGYGRDHEIVVTNYGVGEARDVSIETTGANNEEGSWELLGGSDTLDFLGPGASFNYRAAIDMGSPSRVNCTVRWTNPDGSEGASRQTMGLF